MICGVCGRWCAPKNRIAERVFIRRMFEYSARKKRAKGPAAYSTLNPDTSSDSPSVRSNGARLVSARVEIYHIAARGQVGMSSQIASCVMLKVWSVKFPERITMFSRISPRLTSYEIVWATARRAPISAYFEFEAQPEPKIEYTARLERARIKRRPKLRSVIGWGRGRGGHKVRARVSANTGAAKKSRGEEVDG